MAAGLRHAAINGRFSVGTGNLTGGVATAGHVFNGSGDTRFRRLASGLQNVVNTSRQHDSIGGAVTVGGGVTLSNGVLSNGSTYTGPSSTIVRITG